MYYDLEGITYYRERDQDELSKEKRETHVNVTIGHRSRIWVDLELDHPMSDTKGSSFDGNSHDTIVATKSWGSWKAGRTCMDMSCGSRRMSQYLGHLKVFGRWDGDG